MNKNFTNENKYYRLHSINVLVNFTDEIKNAKIMNISLNYKNNLKLLFIVFELDFETILIQTRNYDIILMNFNHKMCIY